MDISRLRLSRRDITIFLLCLCIAGMGSVFIFRRQPTEFLVNDRNALSIIFRDVDTLDVTGTRIPGSEGIWRYHIHQYRWEKVPSRELSTDDDDGSVICRKKCPVAQGIVTLCQDMDESISGADDGWQGYTKHFFQVSLKDGAVKEMGKIHHAVSWGILPDHSGIWVRQEVHPVYHLYVKEVFQFYSYRTNKWKVIYRSPWYADREVSDGDQADCSMLRRHGDWLLVFHNAIYTTHLPPPREI